MTHVTSSVTELPRSCKSAAERTAAFLEEEDKYAQLSQTDLKKLTALEQELSKNTDTAIALVAYRL